MSPHKTKGLLLALIANVPNFILCALAIISFVFCLNGTEGAFVSIGTISMLIIRFTAAMHQGLIKNVIDALASSATPYLFYLIQSLAYLFMFFLSVAVTHIGYFFGTKEFKIFGFIKKQKNSE